jgi:DNA-binding transcriptional ArsR family regulator
MSTDQAVIDRPARSGGFRSEFAAAFVDQVRAVRGASVPIELQHVVAQLSRRSWRELLREGQKLREVRRDLATAALIEWLAGQVWSVSQLGLDDEPINSWLDNFVWAALAPPFTAGQQEFEIGLAQLVQPVLSGELRPQRTRRVSQPVQQFVALGDPVRWQLVRLLAAGDEVSLTSLSDLLGTSVAATTYHFGVLHRAGVVQSRKLGRTVCVSLNPDSLIVVGRALDRAATP